MKKQPAVILLCLTLLACLLWAIPALSEEHEHVWGEWTAVDTQTGNRYQYCTVPGCDEFRKEHVHAWQVIESIPGEDCTVKGTKTVQCPYCKKKQKVEGDPGPHSWLAATCTSPKFCTRCSATEGSALSHSWRDATCTDAKTCVNCLATEGAPLGHDWMAATCSRPKTCSRCGAKEGDPLPHTWVAATCTAPKTCSGCGLTDGAPLGHSWLAATCASPKHCTVCGAAEGSALSHEWRAATCTEAKTCVNCLATEGAPLGHDWLDATCTRAKACSRCGAKEGSPLPHTWAAATCDRPKLCVTCGLTDGAPAGHVWADATCTEAKTCIVCGAAEGSPLGHSWKAATCTEPKTCTRCWAKEGSELGHNWKRQSSTLGKDCVTPGRVREKCWNCGLLRTQPGKVGPHSYGPWQKSETQPGMDEKVCAFCGKVKTRESAVASMAVTVASAPAAVRKQKNGTVQVTYTVTNTGTSVIMAPVGYGATEGNGQCRYARLTDDFADLPTLMPGESVDFTLEYNVNPDDILSGSFIRDLSVLASAFADRETGLLAPADDWNNTATTYSLSAGAPRVELPITQGASELEAECRFPPDFFTAERAGKYILAGIELINTGDSMLSAPMSLHQYGELSDDSQVRYYTYPKDTLLAPGDTVSFTLSLDVRQEDVDQGVLIRKVSFGSAVYVDPETGEPISGEEWTSSSASAVGPESNMIRLEIPLGVHTSSMSVELVSVSDSVRLEEGSVAEAEIRLSNNGTTSLQVVACGVHDASGAYVAPLEKKWATGSVALAPDESDTLLLKFAVTEEDIEAGALIRDVDLQVKALESGEYVSHDPIHIEITAPDDPPAESSGVVSVHRHGKRKPTGFSVRLRTSGVSEELQKACADKLGSILQLYRPKN